MTYQLMKDLYEVVKVGKTKGQEEISADLSKAAPDVTDSSTKGRAAVKEWISSMKKRQVQIEANMKKFRKVTVSKLFGALNHENRVDLLKQAIAGKLFVITGKNEMIAACEMCTNINKVSNIILSIYCILCFESDCMLFSVK